MVVWLILLVIIGVLVWVLFSPIKLKIDSDHQCYEIQWLILKVALVTSGEFPKIRLRSWFLRKEFDLRNISSKSKLKKRKKNQTKSEKNKFRKLPKIWKILQSFRIKKLKISLDTDDVIINAYLYPILYQIGLWSRKSISINFSGRNLFQFECQNRLINIIMAYFR